MSRKLSKKIYIVDCDFLYETSKIPNYKAMKLFSYHNQMGDIPTFITHEFQLTGTHDVLYLLRELRDTPFPPGDILDDKRTILMGKEFVAFEDVQELPLAAAVCRPEYSIYQYKQENIFEKASIVQFMNNNVILKNYQDWRRADSRATLVVDESFWDVPTQTVVSFLESLKNEPSVFFLHPIKIKKLIVPEVLEAFMKLKLAKFYKMRYNNNIGDDYDSVIRIIDMSKKLKNKFSYIIMPPLPVKIITKDHWVSKENIFYDFERCLKIMRYAQDKSVRINFRYPKMRLASPSFPYLEFFKTWSNHHHTLCYIEALTKNAAKFYKVSYVDIINNERYWVTAKVRQAIHLIARYPDLIKELGFTGWGGTKYSSTSRINFDLVKEKAIENNIF